MQLAQLVLALELLLTLSVIIRLYHGKHHMRVLCSQGLVIALALKRLQQIDSVCVSVVIEEQEIIKNFLRANLLLLEWPVANVHDLFTFVEKCLPHIEQQTPLELASSIIDDIRLLEQLSSACSLMSRLYTLLPASRMRKVEIAFIV